MKIELTKKQLGQRITELRKQKGMSQDELSRRINISRSSLAQIELGNRVLGASELQKMAGVLGFSLDYFMSDNFDVNHPGEVQEEVKPEITEERISVPMLNLSKFKNVLLYILEKCAGKPNVGETVLYKLLYFSDFNYYEIYEEHLSGATYRKLPYGPVPQKINTIIKQMIDEGSVQLVKTEFHGLQQTRYLPLKKADLTQLKASEKEVIDQVILQMGDWTATTISDYSHKDLPWEVTEEGKTISYNLAFYREAPYSVRIYDESENDD
jgi:transcriptional regulator with XRE-family HTH domain